MRTLRLAIALITFIGGATQLLANVTIVDNYHLIQDPDTPGTGLGWALDANGSLFCFVGGSSTPTGYIFSDNQLNTPLSRLVAPNNFPSSGFGWNAAISQDYALIGSFNEQKDYMYDIHTGNLLRTFSGVGGLAVDGDRVAVGLYTSDQTIPGSAFLYSASTGALIRRLSPADLSGNPSTGDYAFSYQMAFTQDSLVVSSAGANIAYVYDAENGNLRRVLRGSGGDNYGHSLSADNGLVLMGDPLANHDIGRAYLVDVNTGQKLATFQPPADTTIESFGFTVSLRGKWALIGAPYSASLDGRAFLYDITTGDLVTEFYPEVTGSYTALGWRLGISDHYFEIGSGANVPTSVFLSPIPIPEPTTATLLLLGMLGCVGHRRR